MRRKVFRGIWKENSPSKTGVLRTFRTFFSIWVRNIRKNPVFEGEFSFQIVLKILLRIRWLCSRYREGAPGSSFYHDKKLESYDTPIRRYARKSLKKPISGKNRPQKGFEMSEKTLFLKVNFFSDRSKKYSTHPMTLFKVSRRCPWIIFLPW